VCSLSGLDFSNDDSSSSEEDERPKHKTGDFTSLCPMGKALQHITNSDSDVSDDSASRHISDSDSNVSDDSFPEDLSLRVTEIENALCNQDKLLDKVFRENKKLNLELESSFSEIVFL
jgi:hypothetical protein